MMIRRLLTWLGWREWRKVAQQRGRWHLPRYGRWSLAPGGYWHDGFRTACGTIVHDEPGGWNAAIVRAVPDGACAACRRIALGEKKPVIDHKAKDRGDRRCAICGRHILVASGWDGHGYLMHDYRDRKEAT